MKSRTNHTLQQHFEWASDNPNSFKPSLLDRTRVGLYLNAAFMVLAFPCLAITLNSKDWSRATRLVTAPLLVPLSLPFWGWLALEKLVACVATPFLWAGERVMNALLDVFKPLPDKSGSNGQPHNPGPDAPTPAVVHSRSNSPDPEAPSSDQNRADTPSPR